MFDPENDPITVEVSVPSVGITYIQRLSDGSEKLVFLVNPPKNEYERDILVEVKLIDSYTFSETNSQGLIFERQESSESTYTIMISVQP